MLLLLEFYYLWNFTRSNSYTFAASISFIIKTISFGVKNALYKKKPAYRIGYSMLIFISEPIILSTSGFIFIAKAV